MSAGTAARESIELIKAAGARPHAIAIALDRQEKATEKLADGSVNEVSYSAVQYVQGSLGIAVCCIAQLSDLLAYLSIQSGCELGQHLPKVQAYRNRYGVWICLGNDTFTNFWTDTSHSPDTLAYEIVNILI